MIEDKLTEKYMTDLQKKMDGGFSDITLSQGYAGDLLILLNHYVFYKNFVCQNKLDSLPTSM